jgi:hypothetical protein
MSEERDATPEIPWSSGGALVPSGGTPQPDPPPATTMPPPASARGPVKSEEVLWPELLTPRENAPEPQPVASVRRRLQGSEDRPLQFGIVGGKGVGKSYLLQSLVYRSYGEHVGALAPYLDRSNVSLSSGAFRDAEEQERENLVSFVRNFEAWQRLGQTLLLNQRWYRLELPFRTGILGTNRSTLEVELFDGSGEGFFEAPRNRNDATWREAYLDADVMVFCLPLWVAFPGSKPADQDVESHEAILQGFAQTVENFRDLRRLNRQDRPVRTILALTMADDPRSSLVDLRKRWVEPFMQRPGSYLRRLRTQAGVMRYLNNARQVSDFLTAAFFAARQGISGIPKQLNFNGGLPWIVPMSAIEGTVLDQFEEKETSRSERREFGDPVPAHVELPLLMALCEHHNALL